MPVSMGLTRYSSAPAMSARAMFRGSDSDEIISTARSANRFSARRARTSSRPSMIGMFQSTRRAS
jgi:hypothetical protein